MLKFYAIIATMLALSGCSAQARIAGNTTEILKAVRGAREQLYIVAQAHPEVLPDLKRISDQLMIAVDAAYDTQTQLAGVEDQHEYLDTITTVAIYLGGAAIVAGIVFAAWKSGVLTALAAMLPSRERK